MSCYQAPAFAPGLALTQRTSASNEVLKLTRGAKTSRAAADAAEAAAEVAAEWGCRKCGELTCADPRPKGKGVRWSSTTVDRKGGACPSLLDLPSLRVDEVRYDALGWVGRGLVEVTRLRGARKWTETSSHHSGSRQE